MCFGFPYKVCLIYFLVTFFNKNIVYHFHITNPNSLQLKSARSLFGQNNVKIENTVFLRNSLAVVPIKQDYKQ